MRKLSYLAIIAILFFNGCESEQKEELKIIPKIVKVLSLNTSKEYKNKFEYPAQIYSLQNVNMAFEVSGKIVDFKYNVGEMIEKGSIIARLDDTIYKANLQSALANYNKLELDYERYTKLFETNSIAKIQVENAKMALDVANANYQIAQKNYDNTNLIAEFDGILAKKLVDDFARVNAKQQILILQDNSKFKVKFFVPESDIIKSDKNINIDNISKMADFYVVLSADDSTKYRAKLIDISTTAEQYTRTFEITILIDNPKDKTLLPGMTAKVEVYTKDIKDDDIFIPFNAIFTDHTKKSYVWVVDSENKVHKREIKIDRVQKDVAKVSNLNVYEKIVTSGVQFLSENDTIAIYNKIGN